MGAFIKKSSLLTRFAVVLTASILAVGFVLGLYLSTLSTRSYLREKHNTLNVAARMLAVHLEEYMVRLNLEIEHVSVLLDGMPQEQVVNILRQYASKRPEIQALYYQDTNGRSTLEGQWLGKTTPVFTQKRESGSILPANHVNGIPFLMLSSGRVMAQINLNELRLQQGLLHIKLGESGHPYLMDSEGTILSHRHDRYVGRRIDELATFSDGQPVTVDWFTGASQIVLQYDLEGAARMAGVIPLPELGLIVGFSQAVDEIERPVARMRNGLWLSAVILTILIAFLSLYLSRMITKPLQRFLEQLEQIQKGHVYSISGGSSSSEMSLIRCAINKLVNRLHEVSISTVSALVLTLEARDSATMGHSQRVAKIACHIGEIMNLSSKDMRVLARAAMLHDVGKIAVPDSILLKPEQLTEKDRERICAHPVIAVKILSPLLFLKEELIVIEQHHERIDGKGYPKGLSGDGIHPLAKILAVADAYEAMTVDRPYRKAVSHYEAIKQLLDGRGTQFDESVVKAFITLMERRRMYFDMREAGEFGFGIERTQQ